MWQQVLAFFRRRPATPLQDNNERGPRVMQLFDSLRHSGDFCLVTILHEGASGSENDLRYKARMSVDRGLALLLLQGDAHLGIPVNSMVMVSSDTDMYLGEVSGQYTDDTGSLIHRIELEHWVEKAPIRERVLVLAQAS